MRKSIVAVLLASSVFAVSAQAQNYSQSARDAQRQAWENAGMGIAINAAGVLVGSAVGAIVNSGSSSGYAPAPSYGAPPMGYATPQVVNPYYYPQGRACVTQQAPVYDSYGRVVEFVQYCANPAR